MVEFEGDVIKLGNPEVKLRQFRTKVFALEAEVKSLKTLNEEKDREITELNEKLKELRLNNAILGKGIAISKLPPKKRFKIRKNFIAETKTDEV
jgi:predicted RNase H-like nuclease (RuvC/YqgF family)